MAEEQDKSETVQIGRVAFRVEGNDWRAYYAMPDTMERAIPLASIKLGLVARKDRKEAFMALLRDVVADMMEASGGHRPDWGSLQIAPDSERAAPPPAPTCICGVGDVDGALHRDWCPLFTREDMAAAPPPSG